MKIKYNGVKVKIKVMKYNFDYIYFNYGKYIILYMNIDLNKFTKRKILHEAIKS